MRYRYWIGIGASIILGLIFLTAGLGKLLQQTETFMIFYTSAMSFLPPALTDSAPIWLPAIELLIGLLLILGVVARLVAACSSALIAIFIINNSWLLSQGLGYEPCECFGILERILQGTLSTTGALYLDIIMLALAFVTIFCYPGKFLTVRPWFMRKGKIDNGSINKETG